MRELNTSGYAEIEIIIALAAEHRFQCEVKNLSAFKRLEALILVGGNIKIAVLTNRNFDPNLRRLASGILQSRDHQGAFNLRLFDRVLFQRDAELVETDTKVLAESELHHGICDRRSSPCRECFECQRA